MNLIFKELTFLTISILSPFIVTAQDTTYFNHQREIVGRHENYSHFQVSKKDSINTRHLIKYLYNKSGVLIHQSAYLPGIKEVKDGKEIAWYEDGKPKAEIHYFQHKLHGLLTTYYPDGRLKRKDSFDQNTLLHGDCYDKDGKRIKHFPYEVQPAFPGGVPKLYKYLSKNMVYPKDLANARLQDRVIVSFNVETDGSITNIKAEGGTPIKQFQEEAIRVVSQMPQWIPAKIDGEKVKVKFYLPINFQL